MSQADYVVSNGTGASVRSDLNGQLAAIVSNNSGAAEPATMYAYQWWANTTTGSLLIRNSANNAWVTVGTLASTNLGLATLASPTFTGTATIPTLTVSTSAGIPLGSAGSPTLFFTGDTNTGLFSPGADTFAITTGGTNRLHVTSGGLVGIGSSSPTNTLHVVGTGRFNVSGANNAVIASDGGDPFIYTEQAAGLKLGTNSTVRMTIDSSGRCGIGSTVPQSRLEVNETGVGSVVIPLTVANQDTSASGTGAGIGFVVDGVSDVIGAQIEGVRTGSAYHQSALVARTRDGSGGGLLERFRCDSSGRVLVGTSSALTGSISQYAKLSVVGNTSNAANGAYFTIGRGSAGTGFGTGVDIGQIIWTDNAGAQFASIGVETDAACGASDFPGRLVFSTTADGASSPTERMRIRSDGRHVMFGSSYVLFALSAAAAGTSDTLFTGRSAATSIGADDGTNRIFIFTNGNVQNSNNSYAGISDIKLKENIVDANSQWNDLKALQVRNYNFKEETGQQTHTQIGLIAQEVKLVSPGLVSESPDRDKDGNDLGTATKSVNYSVLYMKAVKALQEAMERIETLEQRLTNAGIA